MMIGMGIAIPLAQPQFSVAALFAAGEQGGWWDPSDFSTMFQDSAGTTPVTAVGQPVGLIRDKSGRGNHASQATAASRPTLQQDASGFFHLLFDGVDDSLATTATVDMSTTDKSTVFAGITKSSDAATACVVELTANSSLNPGFGMFAPVTAATGDLNWRSTGTVVAGVTSAATFPAPISRVLTGQGDISGTVSVLRVNAVQAGSVATSQGTGNYSNATLNIGRRAGSTLPFNGRIYSLIVRGALSTAAQIAQTERFVGTKMGIAL